LVSDELAAEEQGFVIPEYPPSLADTGQITYPTDEDSYGAKFAVMDGTHDHRKDKDFDSIWSNKKISDQER